LKIFLHQAAEFHVVVDDQDTIHVRWFHCAPRRLNLVVKNCQTTIVKPEIARDHPRDLARMVRF
jgi:hypothetical protein